MPALPQGAAATGPTAHAEASTPMELQGKNGTRCLATPIGPTPGPPPPWGMQNVLCKFKWGGFHSVRQFVRAQSCRWSRR